MERSKSDRVEDLRDRFAASIIFEIREQAWDLESVDKRVGASLRVIADRLFDSELPVDTVLEAAGTRDRAFPVQFGGLVGQPPARFIDDHRIRVGKELVRYSEAPFDRIAQALGYKQVQGFRRAFKRTFGLSPSKFRNWRHMAFDDPRFGRRALAGELAPWEAGELMRHLVDLYLGGSKSSG